MVNEKQSCKFCKDDISLIENYDKAMNDKTQTWDIHHRGEVLPCGRFKVADLKKHGLYYNRPASELIFMTRSDHQVLHHSGVVYTKETKDKISNSKKGTKLTQAQKDKISKALKGRKFSQSTIEKLRARRHSQETRDKVSKTLTGKFWFTNGIVNVRCFTCPEGFRSGVTPKRKRCTE